MSQAERMLQVDEMIDQAAETMQPADPAQGRKRVKQTARVATSELPSAKQKAADRKAVAADIRDVTTPEDSAGDSADSSGPRRKNSTSSVSSKQHEQLAKTTEMQDFRRLWKPFPKTTEMVFQESPGKP